MNDLNEKPIHFRIGFFFSIWALYRVIWVSTFHHVFDKWKVFVIRSYSFLRFYTQVNLTASFYTNHQSMGLTLMVSLRCVTIVHFVGTNLEDTYHETASAWIKEAIVSKKDGQVVWLNCNKGLLRTDAWLHEWQYRCDSYWFTICSYS